MAQADITSADRIAALKFFLTLLISFPSRQQKAYTGCSMKISSRGSGQSMLLNDRMRGLAFL